MPNKNDDVKIVDAHGKEYKHDVSYGLTKGKAEELVKQLNNPKPRNIFDKHYRVAKVVR